MTIVEFLLARIAEDEAGALAIQQSNWLRCIVYVPAGDGVTESVGIERVSKTPKRWARIYASADRQVDDGWVVHEFSDRDLVTGRGCPRARRL